MTVTEQDLLEELAYAESEGPSESYEDDGMGMEADESDFGDEDELESGDADMYEDYVDFGDESDFADESESEAVLGNMIGSALGAEDEDEFITGLARRLKKAAPFVSKVLKLIPHPAAQIGGQLLGKLRAEGGNIEDALEAVAEIAVRDRRALPVVAGLAARTVLRNRAASMSPGQRRQAVQTATRAAKTLVNAGGPKAIRALPKVAKSVRRTAAAKGTPAPVRPKVLQRTAAKVAQNPRLLQKLSKPSAKGQAFVTDVSGNGQARSYSLSGPARISINIT